MQIDTSIIKDKLAMARDIVSIVDQINIEIDVTNSGSIEDELEKAKQGLYEAIKQCLYEALDNLPQEEYSSEGLGSLLEYTKKELDRLAEEAIDDREN